MSRVGIALLVGVFALSSAPVDIDAAARRTKTTATSKAALAKKKRAQAKARAKAKAKAKARAKAKGKQVAVATKISRGSEGMPNGFEWPPNEAMTAAGLACEKTLDERGISWERATPEGKMIDPIYVPSMEIGGIRYTPAYSKGVPRISCHLVQILADVGPELARIGVREIKYGSIYRNTNVRAHGTTKPILSRHALGIAMDIKEFIDDKGRVANVELDYLKADELLHGIEDTLNASQKFRILLTPGNDPISHYDHFHIEAAVDFSAFQ
jgi:hypothetical protein